MTHNCQSGQLTALLLGTEPTFNPNGLVTGEHNPLVATGLQNCQPPTFGAAAIPAPPLLTCQLAPPTSFTPKYFGNVGLLAGDTQTFGYLDLRYPCTTQQFQFVPLAAVFADANAFVPTILSGSVPDA